MWLSEGLYLAGRKEYDIILKDLWGIVFYSLVNYDDNRAHDGLELRREYEALTGNKAPEGPCTVLEVLIALARRMAFELYDPSYGSEEQDIFTSFWELIDNLNLNPRYSSAENRYNINFWLDRKYDRNGRGGAFPLRKTKTDQRKAELWYQLQEYLSEKP